MDGHDPLWAPATCLALLIGVAVLLITLIVPTAAQARVLENLAVGATLAVLISRAIER